MGTVYKNSHVYLAKDKHYYSVPYYYLRKKVKIIYTLDKVEIYYKYKQITSHDRDRTPNQYTTEVKHLPESHRYIKEINPEKLISQADEIGVNTRELIIDDFGLQPLDNQSRLSFLEIIEDRHEARSTILTSQVPVEKWHEIIGDKTVADAILDRLVYSSHRIELKGESYRKKMRKNKEE